MCVCGVGGMGGRGVVDMRVRKQFRSALFGSASVYIFLFLNLHHSPAPSLQRSPMSVHPLIPITHTLSLFLFLSCGHPFLSFLLSLCQLALIQNPTLSSLRAGDFLDVWTEFRLKCVLEDNWRGTVGRYSTAVAWINSLLIQVIISNEWNCNLFTRKAAFGLNYFIMCLT